MDHSHRASGGGWSIAGLPAEAEARLEDAIDETAVLGDFTQLLMGVRREASVEILKLSDFGSKLVLDFIGYLRGDFVVLRPKSFCKITGLS